jgi:hypothetical protein
VDDPPHLSAPPSFCLSGKAFLFFYKKKYLEGAVKDSPHLFAAADCLARMEEAADELVLVASSWYAVLLAQVLQVAEAATLQRLQQGGIGARVRPLKALLRRY